VADEPAHRDPRLPRGELGRNLTELVGRKVAEQMPEPADVGLARDVREERRGQVMNEVRSQPSIEQRRRARLQPPPDGGLGHLGLHTGRQPAP
jgi:hypothetical protein